MPTSNKRALLARTTVAVPLVIFVAASNASAQTTELTFDFGLPSPGLVPQAYGDNVSAPQQGGFQYGGSGTFTPNVKVAYGNEAPNGTVEWFPSSYNNLVNVIYASIVPGADLLVTLTADDGFEVALGSFDVGNFGTAVSLPAVRVLDEFGGALWEVLDHPLDGTQGLHSHFVPNPVPRGPILVLQIELTGLGASANIGLDNVLFHQSTSGNVSIGASYCGPAVPNSSGYGGGMRIYGTSAVAAADLRLVAVDLPLHAFGYFIASETQGFATGPGGSQGNLCLSGQVTRFSTSVASSGGEGVLELIVDPANVGGIAGQFLAGETWHFQAWHRDQNPTVTSNFTDASSATML